MKDNKYHTRQVTERFLQEAARIIGSGKDKKMNYDNFLNNVGLLATNFSRIKKHISNNVPMEAAILLCIHYGTDPVWLFMGDDYEAKVDEKLQTLDKMIGSMGKLLKQTERKPVRTRVK